MANSELNKPRWHRWVRFSLRGLLGFTLLSAVFFAWVDFQVDAAREQRLAVAAIIAGGGDVAYNGKEVLSARAGDEREDSPAATWWTDLLGEDPRLRVTRVRLTDHFSETPDRFRWITPRGVFVGPKPPQELTRDGLTMRIGMGQVVHDDDEPLEDGSRGTSDSKRGDELLAYVPKLHGVEYLKAAGPTVTDAGLAHLRTVTTLRELDLRDSGVTDAGLAKIAHLQSLHLLNLRINKKITDAGMSEIAKLRDLRTLVLEGTQISDAGIRALAELPRLTTLVLTGTQVSDEGLKQLALIESLEDLTLTATQVSDIGMKHLAGLKNLKRLDLTYSRIGDAGVAELESSTSLRELCLQPSEVKLTDAALKSLARMRNLRVVHLYSRDVTNEGVKQLETARPNLNVLPKRPQVGGGFF